MGYFMGYNILYFLWDLVPFLKKENPKNAAYITRLPIKTTRSSHTKTIMAPGISISISDSIWL